MGTGKARSPIEGRLGSVSLNDLIQLLAMARRTATLALEQNGERGLVFFRDGQIVHASAGSREGEEGLLELLEWTEADFSVEDGVRSLPRVSVTVGTEALLLEAMRRLDERAARRSRGEEQCDRSPRRRFPRRPRRRPRARVPWAGAAFGLVATVALGLLAAGDVLFGAPWAELPRHRSPLSAPSRNAAPPRVAPPGIEASAGELARVREEAAPPAPASTESADRGAPSSASASAPPPAREGYLTVVAEPWAFIAVDGALIGETPLQRIALAAGKHELTLTHPNVTGAIRAEVELSPEDEIVRRYSFADVGYLLLLAESWANVEIDGRPVGQTPLPRIAVPAGAHVIRFHHPELGTRERAGVVRIGETTRVHADWREP